jgi:hypothetical protein
MQMSIGGGVIPRQLYQNDSIDEPDTMGDDVTATQKTTHIKLNEINIYQNVELQPGQFHEIIIKNDDEKAVLTWDYESVKPEVLFTIYETFNSTYINVTNGKKKKYYSHKLKFQLYFQFISHL